MCNTVLLRLGTWDGVLGGVGARELRILCRPFQTFFLRQRVLELCRDPSTYRSQCGKF